jgi:hypothetical protein
LKDFYESNSYTTNGVICSINPSSNSNIEDLPSTYSLLYKKGVILKATHAPENKIYYIDYMDKRLYIDESLFKNLISKNDKFHQKNPYNNYVKLLREVFPELPESMKIKHIHIHPYPLSTPYNSVKLESLDQPINYISDNPYQYSRYIEYRPEENVQNH